MKVIFSNEIIASDFFNEITNNYTEDILDPYHGRIDWYLTNFYEKPVSEFEVDDYETKYYNKDLLSPTTNEVHITKDEKGHTISVSHFEMNV